MLDKKNFDHLVKYHIGLFCIFILTYNLLPTFSMSARFLHFSLSEWNNCQLGGRPQGRIAKNVFISIIYKLVCQWYRFIGDPMRSVSYIWIECLSLWQLVNFFKEVSAKNLLFNSMDCKEKFIYLIKCESILLATFIEKIWIIRQEALYAND